MKDKMRFYTDMKQVPPEAKKKITGGRLSGMTDINPMWRIKKLTETFGPCGEGWIYRITDKKLETGANGEIAAFVDIELRFQMAESDNGCVWSEPIPGTGGSMFVAKEKNGMHVSDECFKMALTDALSVACKSLGMAADVYFEKDRTKYDTPKQPEGKAKSPAKQQTKEEERAAQPVVNGTLGVKCTCGKVIDFGKTDPKKWIAHSKKTFGGDTLCLECINKRKEQQA